MAEGKAAGSRRRGWATCPAAIAAVVLSWAATVNADEIWLLIDTGEQTLSVMQGSERLREYSGISIGRNGATARKVHHDKKTPLGTFRISSIRNHSRFRRFFGLSYPDLEYAGRAFEAGEIAAADLAAIRQAHEQGLEPPLTTPLGGNIGIHGIGEGDPRFHEDYNWTDGCVALSNGEVDELLQWIRLRMIVVII